MNVIGIHVDETTVVGTGARIKDDFTAAAIKKMRELLETNKELLRSDIKIKIPGGNNMPTGDMGMCEQATTRDNLVRPQATETRRIEMEKVFNNGYVVRVGCKELVFETAEKMLSELARYLANSAAVEKEYLEKYK